MIRQGRLVVVLLLLRAKEGDVHGAEAVDGDDRGLTESTVELNRRTRIHYSINWNAEAFKALTVFPMKLCIHGHVSTQLCTKTDK